MPSQKIDHTGGSPAVVSAGASPVTLVIEPHSAPISLTITSASAITVTGTAVQGRPVDIVHVP